MTETEAKSKWCPFARATMFVRGNAGPEEQPIAIVGHGSNRLVCDDAAISAAIQATIEATGATRCIGTACMAWRPHITGDSGTCGLVRP